MSADLATDLRAKLTASLCGSGALRSRRWVAAFAAVPRHLFLPEFFAPSADRMSWRLVSSGDGERWLRMVYADDAWVTQLNADPGLRELARSGAPVTGQPTSSSSAPSLMARMLEALDVTGHSRVLELGTGTGYNAALLCAGLSPDQVTSADIDPAVLAEAGDALARAGCRPLLLMADCDSAMPLRASLSRGMLSRKPPAERAGGGAHDRLIVTYGIPRVPAGWLSLMQPGGLIVAPLYRRLTAGPVVRLTVSGDGRAVGRFLPFRGGFMPSRRRAGPDLLAAMRAARSGQAAVTSTDLPDLALGAEPEPWHDYAGLVLGDVEQVDSYSEDSGVSHWLLAADGSWACQSRSRGAATVVQGGQRRLWAELERARSRWADLGKPPLERLGLTVTAQRQQLWIDDASSIIAEL